MNIKQNPLRIFFFTISTATLIVVFPVNIKQTSSQISISSLQLQTLQSRDFKTTKEIAFAAAVTILQDAGYIIDSGDFTSGIILATSPVVDGLKIKKKKMKKSKWIKDFSKATVFIESMPNQSTRARVNIVAVHLDNRYFIENRTDTPIVDPAIYENFFESLSKAIFIRIESQ